MISLYRTLATMAPMLSALLLSAIPAASAEQAGVWQYWDYPAASTGLAGRYNTDQHLTISKSGSTRFFAHQFYLQNGHIAYMGLQDTPGGRKAIFSVWNATEAQPGNAAVTCKPFDGEGVGMQCFMPFEWSEGVPYRLRLWMTNERGSGSTQWLATVQDSRRGDGQDTFLGWIWAPEGAGYVSSSVSWIEDYKLNVGGSCRDEEPAEATFTLPSLDGGDATAAFGASETAMCAGTSHSSRIDRIAGAAVLHE